jgi:hypothetical protein
MIKNEGRCITNVPNLDFGDEVLNERFYQLWYDRLMANELPEEQQCNWHGWFDPRFADVDNANNDKVYSMVDVVADLPEHPSESKRKGGSKQKKADKKPIRGKKPKKI